MNSRFFKLLKLYREYSISLNSSNVGNFFWSWRLPSKPRNRKLLSCVHVLHETWNKAFFTSHSCSAGKEVFKKKREARAVVLPIQTNRIAFCRSRWRRRCSIKGPSATTTTASKNNWFYVQNTSSVRTSHFLVHFFDVHCTTTAWNLPMRRYMEDVDIRR